MKADSDLKRITEGKRGYLLLKIKITLFFLTILIPLNLKAAELLIGSSSVDITPKLPVALDGQFNLRIADTVETPLSANVIALESREGGTSLDAAIMVSCDLVAIPVRIIVKVREEVHRQIPGLDPFKIFISAIHTHTAPVMDNDSSSSFRYPVPEKGVLQVDEYDDFLVHRVSEAIVKAWKNRQPGRVTWGLSHAAIGYNRRVVYSGPVSEDWFGRGTAQMYGKTDIPEFVNLEGTEDHDVNILFFEGMNNKLIGMAIDIPCPAQVVENRYAVNSDYWYPVRERLRKKHGKDLCVLGWIGAAGDQSPHPIYRKAAEERMMKLRNTDQLDEIAGRIEVAVDEAWDAVRNDFHQDAILIHKTATLELPMRIVTEAEYEFSKAERDKSAGKIEADPKTAEDLLANMTWNEDVIKRYERQKTDQSPKQNVEIHVIRLGDIAICTNEFELFTDYGLRMQARSRALQTFVVQLAGPGSYLPTEKAVAGGGYSAVIQSDIISPAGGQILVDNTVKMIEEMFP